MRSFLFTALLATLFAFLINALPQTEDVPFRIHHSAVEAVDGAIDIYSTQECGTMPWPMSMRCHFAALLDTVRPSKNGGLGTDLFGTFDDSDSEETEDFARVDAAQEQTQQHLEKRQQKNTNANNEQGLSLPEAFLPLVICGIMVLIALSAALFQQFTD